jgi:hypothetical protein
MEKWRRYFSLTFIVALALVVFGCSSEVVSIGTVDLVVEEMSSDTPLLQVVKRFNADYFDSRIARWGDETETVSVYDSAGVVSLEDIFDEINAAKIGPKLMAGESDSMVKIYQDDSISCGDLTRVESWNYWNNHEMASVSIGVNFKPWWCPEKLVVKHALIHSLGFWGHTTDWSVMRGISAEDRDWLYKWTDEITDPVVQTLRELYKIAPGTKIN